jgi:hypothetical protein
MPQLDYTTRVVLHRLSLTEGHLDRELERLKQYIPRLERLRADIRYAIKHVEELLKANSQSGPQKNFDAQAVKMLKVGECPDGSLWFEIDESGFWFSLPKRAAGLLKYLLSKSNPDHAGNDLMPLFSRQSVLEYLVASGGRKYKDSFVYQMINRLGEKLRVYDSRKLVDSRKEGVGFLVRRNGVRFLKLDEPPNQPVRRRPHSRFLQRSRKHVVSIAAIGAGAKVTANWKARNSCDHG